MTSLNLPLTCARFYEKDFTFYETFTGNYGIVIKEWKTITRVYPDSTSNLNKVTKQIDVDVLDNFGNKLPIKNLKSNIEIIIERQPNKDPKAVEIPGK